MEECEAKPIVYQHPRHFFTLYSDGSVTRRPIVPCLPASPHFSNGTATKDLLIDSVPGLWARVFLPHSSLSNPSKQLPVVLYMHGGAYCIGDPSWPSTHAFCRRMALMSDAVWISLAYRLSPEFRLPVAFEDGFAALSWLQSQAYVQANGATADPWLQEFADFSRCFLAGVSAGGAIAFNVAMRAVGKDWAPLNVRGLMLIHPGFHTEALRQLMVESDADQVHRCYDLALPEGANLDYPPINPLNPDGPSLSQLCVYRNVLVAAAEKDFRYDMTLKFYETVKAFCENVELVISKGQGHSFHLFASGCEEAKILEKKLVGFLCRC